MTDRELIEKAVRYYWNEKESDRLMATMPKWTPVSDGLPEPFVEVLTDDGFQNMTIAFYIGKTEEGIPIWKERDGVDHYGFTKAWHPLPEPYREDGEA